MAEAPEGFKAQPYQNTYTGKDETVYVCNTCHPQWDTFDLAAAKAHPESQEHSEGSARTAARRARR
jgi:hypothetical protein